MQLLTLFSLSFTSILLTKCALADEFLKRLPVVPENGYQDNEKSFNPSPLKIDSSYALMRNNTNKHLTYGCAITPDSTGHVDIPGDWTSIGGWAFGYCQELKSVTIPASVTIIGESAFQGCDSMTEVTFLPGSALTTIGNSAFYSSGLLSVTIPASVTTIGENAFSSCNSLTEVIFFPGSALTTIGNSAFYYSGLLLVSIPASVTTIGDYAFCYCYSLTEVTFSPSSALTTIGNGAFLSSGLLSVTIPASVTTIGANAFSSSDGGFLANVTFSPNSALTAIEYGAFSRTKLLSVTIPASVTSIGDYAFYGCNRLTQITFLPGSALTTIGSFAFQYTDMSSVILPSSVTTIGIAAFTATVVFKQKCEILPDSTGHVDIPDDWTHIPDKTFVSCSELRSIHIPASVTFIGNYAFYHNKLLSHVTFALDSTLTTIGNGAFYSSGLLSLTLPASVITIGKDAFKDCNRLAQVTFASGSALTTIGNDAFGKYVHFECLNTQVVTYSVSAFLCRTPCYQANQVRQPDGSCVCVRGSKNLDGGCILCQNGYSTLQGGHQCIAAKPVSILNEKKCRGYPSIRNLLQENSVSIKYMSSSEEKMIVFSGVTKAFFDAVATVEVRYLISNHKVSAGGSSFTEILSKDQDYYNKRYLLKVPSYTGQTSFHLSFASCTDQLIKSASTGKYISKVRLIFYGVSPESMLSFETIAGCRDYYLDQDTPFVVDDGVCFYNPEMFE